MKLFKTLGFGFALCGMLAFTGCAKEKQEEPIDPKYKEDPDMRDVRRSGGKESVAVRGDTHPHKRILFFNNFGIKHTKLVIEQLKDDDDFVEDEFFMDAGKQNRITVECSYKGKHLRKSVYKAVEKVGIMAHFRETDAGEDLPKHLEINRTKSE